MSVRKLLDTLPQTGRIEWIGTRPARRAALKTPHEISVDPELGIVGDRYAGRSGKRQLTLVQAEHAAVIAALTGRDPTDPEAIFMLLRRNLAVSGLNVAALVRQRFTIGDVVAETTGLAHPCSRMEEAFGPGGYNAVRGHGGITARVLTGGVIRVGAQVRLLADDD